MEVLSIFESSKAVLAIAAVLFGGCAAIPYLVGIFQGHRPPYSTYLGWFLLGATGFWFHYLTILPEDPKWSVYLPAVFVAIPLTYLLVLIYLRAGWHLDRRDKLCLTGIFISWVIWVASELYLPNTGWMMGVPLAAFVITDAFASWPILQDAYRGHESGRMMKWSWGMTFVATIFGCLAVDKPFSLEIVYPVYQLTMMGMMAICSLGSRYWLKPSSATGTVQNAPAE